MLAALPPCDPTEVFANATTEYALIGCARVILFTRLRDVQAWGFDYDFTLVCNAGCTFHLMFVQASYTEELQPLIYDFAVDNLVKNGG